MTTLLSRLFDDAAIFPPGNATPCDAVRSHLSHLGSQYADAVGPLVVSDATWREVSAVLPIGEAIDVTVVVTDGPSGVERSLRLALDEPSVRLQAIEVSPAGRPGLAAVAGALEALAAVAASGVQGSQGVQGVVEVPLDEETPRAVAALAGSGATAKLRTGGLTDASHPDELTLATAVVASARAGVPFKLTAGLHHAVRLTEPGTGFQQHGLLNVVLAVDAALSGSEPAEVAELLATRDRQAVAAEVKALPEERVEVVRRLWRSVGTCSIAGPVAELAELGVLEEAQLVGSSSWRSGARGR